MFCEDGFCRPIREFYFQIDTVNHPPIFCKPTRYVPHESEVIKNPMGQIDEDGVVEDEYGLWVAMVVIAVKPHQKNVTCHEYQWRLCVSYQKQNQVTNQFSFVIP